MSYSSDSDSVTNTALATLRDYSPSPRPCTEGLVFPRGFGPN